MFALIPLGIAAFAGVVSIIGLCGGGGLVVIGLAADQVSRRGGYRKGEGVFTPRDGGYWGVNVSLESNSDLGMMLAALAAKFPEHLEKFSGKRIRLTKSEGAQVRAMLIPVLELYGDLSELEKETGLWAEVEQMRILIGQALKPVGIFLSAIPKSRIKS